MLFGSDAPMVPTSGEAFTMDARKSLEDLDIAEAGCKRIYSGNVLRLLKRG